MKALVYTDVETLTFQDFEVPVAAKGQSVVKLHASGICGSDMHAFLGHDARRLAPCIFGHESAGIAMDGPMAGKRVTINPLVGCGACDDCLAGRENICAARTLLSIPPAHGTFADYVAVRSENLVEIPTSHSFEQASLAEPIACGWHAVRLSQRMLNTQTPRVLVIGGGPIGVGAALCATAQGAVSVTISEPNALRQDYLRGKGFDVIAPETAETGFDLIIDAVGFPATRQSASALAAPGGVIAHIGLGSSEGGLDIRRMTLQEISFIGTYTYTAQDFRDTCNAMFDGRLGALDWIETRPLSEGQRAFEDIRAGRNAAPKIVLHPNL